MIDLNATQAAIRAGYSPKTAQEQGSRLLSKVMVASALARELAARSVRTGITADRVMQEIAKLAFVNASDIMDINSAVVKPDATREDTACIASVKVKKTPTMCGDIIEKEIKLFDKIKSLDMLAKHLGIDINGAGDDADMTRTGVVELPPVMDADLPPEGPAYD